GVRRGLMAEHRKSVRVRTPMRGRWMAVLSACAVAVAGLTVAPAGATTPTQVYSANFTLSCVLAPGVLNVAGNVPVAVSATGPSFVHNGDVFNLTGATTSLMTPAAWSNSFAALQATEAAGAVQNFVLDGTGTTPSSINAATIAPFGSLNVLEDGPG